MEGARKYVDFQLLNFCHLRVSSESHISKENPEIVPLLVGLDND
jgi:hypothetical protein